MSNPPRRSRPKKPATTIDLEAKPVPAVGYPGPMSDASLDASAAPSESASLAEPGILAVSSDASSVSEPVMPGDAETRLDAAASPVDGDREAAVAASTTDAFAAEESLRGSGASERSAFDETILSAAVPDFVTEGSDTPSGPPAPTYDYNTHPAPAPESRGGFGSVLGGAVLGAVLALAGAGALQYAGLLPAVGVEETSDAAPQFASTGDVQQVSTDLTAVRAEVEQLRSAQAAGGTGTGATSADLTAVADRVTAIEQRNEARAASGAVNDQASGAAQAAATAAAATADGAKQAADAATTAAIEAKQAADGAKQAADGASQTAGQAEQAAAQARQTGETASQAAATASQAAATASQAASAAQAGADKANTSIADLSTRLDAMEASNKAAGVAISAAALKAAIDRGGSFMSELEAFATAAGRTPAVDTLRDFAAEGVPSAEALQADWAAVSDEIATIIDPVDPTASVSDQLLSGLSGLVKTRPVAGAAPAASVKGPTAVLQRLNADVETGDFAGWLAEWKRLPQAARTASTDFRDRVDARVRTERIVGDTLSKAVNAASGTAG